MTDRIQAEFEKWATDKEFPDLTQSMGRYNRAVVRWMWEAWQKQAERVSDLIAQLDRSHKRSTELLRQCRDHDARRTAAMAQAASLAEEADRLNALVLALTAERDHWKANHDNRVNAAKILMDRTDMPLERVGAYKQYVTALEANQKLQDALIAAEAELAKLREQEPVAWCDPVEFADDPWSFQGFRSRTKNYPTMPLYARPVPAPAKDSGA